MKVTLNGKRGTSSQKTSSSKKSSRPKSVNTAIAVQIAKESVHTTVTPTLEKQAELPKIEIKQTSPKLLNFTASSKSDIVRSTGLEVMEEVKPDTNFDLSEATSTAETQYEDSEEVNPYLTDEKWDAVRQMYEEIPKGTEEKINKGTKGKHANKVKRDAGKINKSAKSVVIADTPVVPQQDELEYVDVLESGVKSLLTYIVVLAAACAGAFFLGKQLTPSLVQMIISEALGG